VTFYPKENHAWQRQAEHIPGRAEALRVERELIDAYYQQHGHNPKGNKYPVRR